MSSSPPVVGLADIFERHRPPPDAKQELSTQTIDFLDETSNESVGVALPLVVTAADLKEQARALFGHTLRDDECLEGEGLKLFYPEGGLASMKTSTATLAANVETAHDSAGHHTHHHNSSHLSPNKKTSNTLSASTTTSPGGGRRGSLALASSSSALALTASSSPGGSGSSSASSPTSGGMSSRSPQKRRGSIRGGQGPRLHELKDEHKWQTSASHWSSHRASRRDAALLRHTNDACALIGAKVAPGARTAGAALRLSHLVAVPANLQGLERLQHMYLVNNAVLDLLSYVDPDRLANPHTINNGEDIASEHGSSIKEEEEDDDDDSAAAAAADLVAGLGNEHGDSSDSDEESGLAPDECEPLIVAQGLHLQWVLANNSPAANGGGNGGRGSSADAGLPPSYAPFKRMIQMGLPEETIVREMLEAKLNTNELGLKASLATTLSYGGRVKIKKRSNKYVDDTLHAEDAPTTVPVLRAMRRSVGGVLARHLEGRRPVFAPSPVEEMEDVPISEQKDGEDESERIEEGEKNPASDKVVGNDLESINNEKHSKNQTNIRSRNDELALNNKTSIELDEPLLPEGQQAAAATTTAKKVGAALKVVSIEAESGAWHQLDGPNGRAACDWAAYLALGAAWRALQSPEDHLNKNGNSNGNNSSSSSSSGVSARRNSHFPPVTTTTTTTTTTAVAAEVSNSNSASNSNNSSNDSGAAAAAAAENQHAFSPEQRIASAIRQRHAPSLFACALLVACNGGAEEVHAARSDSNASVGDVSGNKATSEEIPRPKSPGSAKKQVGDSSPLLGAAKPPSSPLPLRALACSVACYLAVHEPSLRASLALLASPPAPLTAATTTDTTNRRRSSSSNSKSSGNATSDGWSLPMLLPGGCLVSISHLLWSPDAHVGACAATLLAAAVSDSAHRAQIPASVAAAALPAVLAFAQRLVVEQAPVLAAQAAAAKTKAAAAAAVEASAMKKAAANNIQATASDAENTSAAEASAAAVVSNDQDSNVEAAAAATTNSTVDVAEKGEADGAVTSDNDVAVLDVTEDSNNGSAAVNAPAPEEKAAASTDASPSSTATRHLPWAAQQQSTKGKKKAKARNMHEWLPPGPGTLRGADGRAAAGSLDHALVAAAGLMSILAMTPTSEPNDHHQNASINDSSDTEKTLSTFQSNLAEPGNSAHGSIAQISSRQEEERTPELKALLDVGHHFSLEPPSDLSPDLRPAINLTSNATAATGSSSYSSKNKGDLGKSTSKSAEGASTSADSVAADVSTGNGSSTTGNGGSGGVSVVVRGGLVQAVVALCTPWLRSECLTTPTNAANASQSLLSSSSSSSSSNQPPSFLRGGYGPGLSEVQVRCSIACLTSLAKAAPVSVAAALETQGLLALLVLAELPPTEDPAATPSGGAAPTGQAAGGGSANGGNASALSAFQEEAENEDGARSEQGCEEVLACLAHLAIAASPKTCQGAAAHAAATKRDKGSSTSCDAAIAALSELVSVHHVVERLSAVRHVLVHRARATLPTDQAQPSTASNAPTSSLKKPETVPLELSEGNGEEGKHLADSAVTATDTSFAPILSSDSPHLPPQPPRHHSSHEKARLRALQTKRWSCVKLASAAIMHFTALAHDNQVRQDAKDQQQKAAADAAAAAAAAATAAENSTATTAATNAGASSAGGGAGGSTSSTTATGDDGGSGSDSKKAASTATSSTKLPALKQSGGMLNSTRKLKKSGLGGIMNSFGGVVLKVKAKLLFAKHRLVCVAQQLWSENVGVAIAAAAALWMLGRDDATRRALSQLCLDTEAAVHGASVVAAAVEKATTAKNHAASVQAQVNSEIEASGKKLTVSDRRNMEARCKEANDAAARATKQQQEAQNKATLTNKLAAGLAPIAPRLQELAEHSADPELRAWSLAALANTCAVDPWLRDSSASTLVPLLTRCLCAYEPSMTTSPSSTASSRQSNSHAAAGATSAAAEAAGIGTGVVGNSKGRRASTLKSKRYAATKRRQESAAASTLAGQQRIGALTCSMLLQMAYHHLPSLQMVRKGSSKAAVNNSSSNTKSNSNSSKSEDTAGQQQQEEQHTSGCLAVEGALLRLANCIGVARRVRCHALQLLLLICADGMDVELSGELPREDASSFSSSSSTAPAAAMASKSARPILPALPTAGATTAAAAPNATAKTAADAATAAAAVEAEPAASSSATTNKTSPAAPTVSAATPATSTPSTATGAAATTGTHAPTVSNASSLAPFGVHSPLSLLSSPTTSITPLARAKASASSAGLGQWGLHLLLEELCCNLLKDFVDDLDGDVVGTESSNSMAEASAATAATAAAADDKGAAAVPSQQPSVGSQSKADLIANASKIAAAERAANAAALKASQQAAAGEALVQTKAKRAAEKMRASQMASFFGFSPRNGGDGNDQEDEWDVLGKFALATLADLTARRKASRVAVVLLGDIPRLCNKLLASAAVDDSALQEVADTAAGWYQEYERWTAEAVSLEDEVNVAVKLRRPDADELVAAMAAKHAKAQEALLHVPNPPSNMVPTHTIANAGNNKTATTKKEINQSGTGGDDGGGSDSNTFNTLGDRLWRRTGALHLIMNCTAGTSEEAFEALAEVSYDDLLVSSAPPPHWPAHSWPGVLSSPTLIRTTQAAWNEASAIGQQLSFASLANLSRSPAARVLISKRALSRGLLPPGATDWAQARVKKRSQNQRESRIEVDQSSSSPSSAMAHVSKSGEQNGATKRAAPANNNTSSGSDLKSYSGRPLSEGAGPRRHRKMNQASCNAEAKFKTATTTTPPAESASHPPAAPAAAGSLRRSQHLNDAASNEPPINVVDPAYEAAVQAWMFGARKDLHPAPEGAPTHRLKIGTNLPLTIATAVAKAAKVVMPEAKSPQSPSRQKLAADATAGAAPAEVLHAYAGAKPLSVAKRNPAAAAASSPSLPSRAELAVRMPKSPGEWTTRARSASGAAALTASNKTYPHARDPWHPDTVNLRKIESSSSSSSMTTKLSGSRSYQDEEQEEEPMWTNPLRPSRPEVAITLNPSISKSNHLAFLPSDRPFVSPSAHDGHSIPLLQLAHRASSSSSPSRRQRHQRPSSSSSVTYGGLSHTGDSEGGEEEGVPMKSITSALAEMHDDTTGANDEESTHSHNSSSKAGKFNRKKPIKVKKTNEALGTQRTAMWPHVAGSAVGAEAGLVAFRAASDVTDADDVTGIKDTTLFYKGRTRHTKSSEGGRENGQPRHVKTKGDSGSTPLPSDGGFFLYRDGLPAQAFAPAPLPAPLPPVKRCDVFQRRLPRAPDAPPEDKVQVVGRWALSTSVGTPLARWSSPPPLPGYRAESVLQYALESAASGGAGVMRYTEHNDTSDKDNFGAGVEQFLAPELSPVAAVRVGENLVRGGFLPQRLGILVRAPQPKPPPPPVPPPTVGPPWEYTESSIFVPRAKKSSGWDILDRMSLTDARSMLDNEDHQEKAFKHDWTLCLKKQERFLNLIKKGVALSVGDLDRDVGAVKSVLKTHYHWLMYVFMFHASSDVSATNAAYMGWLTYSALLDLAGITDENQRGCKQVDLDSVFKAAIWQSKSSESNNSSLEALSRHEWLECVVRIAKAKFGQTTRDNQLAPAVEALVLHMKEKLSDDATSNDDLMRASDLRDQWRRRDFYVESTDKVYRKWRPRLEEMYKDRVDWKDVGGHSYWTLAEWVGLLESCKQFEDASFSREDGNLCFYLAKFEVVDYDTDPHRHEHLDWLSFLEALGHVVRFKEMPRKVDLVYDGINSGTLIDLYNKVEKSGQADFWNEYMATHPPQAPEEPFCEQLDAFLALLFYLWDRVPRREKGKHQRA